MNNDTMICKLFVRFQPRKRSYGQWDWGISLYVRFGAEPRIGNVSRSLGRNTIIAPNDSIETLIDGVARSSPMHLRFLEFAAPEVNYLGILK